MSFIVRLWTDDEGMPEVRGEVEHVGTGEKRFFVDYAALLRLLDTWRHDLGHAS